MTTTCARCETYIASDRTYCDAHYQEALWEYERDYEHYVAALEQYHVDLENWNNLSVAEKNALHRIAESEQIGGFAFIPTIIAGFLAFGLVRDEEQMWLGLVAGFAAAALVWYSRRFVGRLSRACLYALWYGVILLVGIYGFVYGLGAFFDVYLFPELFFKEEHELPPTVTAVVFGAATLYSLWKEYSGQHHATYSGPEEPSAPTRPSP